MVGMAKRLTVFAYGLVSYMVFFLTFVYAIGFIGNLYVPKSMDSAARMSFLPALVVDALLLLLFAVQHSVMARPAFKEVLTRFIPAAAERSTYVLCSSLLLIALFAFWQPIGFLVPGCIQQPKSGSTAYWCSLLYHGQYETDTALRASDHSNHHSEKGRRRRNRGEGQEKTLTHEVKFHTPPHQALTVSVPAHGETQKPHHVTFSPSVYVTTTTPGCSAQMLLDQYRSKPERARATALATLLRSAFRGT
jgi:hypothetical protein